MRRASGGGILAVACAAALLSGNALVVSAQQPRVEQAPSFRTGVEVVSVDVGVVDKQGMPVRGLAAADFAVTVAGQQRRVVTAEFISRDGAPVTSPFQTEGAAISTNEGAGIGRLYAFIVDQNTLDLGSARRVSGAATPFFSRLTFSDRTALSLLPVGPNISFTWAHDKVQQGLQRVTGMSRPLAGWEYGSLADARDITNRNMIALRSVGERECGTASAGGFAAPVAPSGGTGSPVATPSAPPAGGASGDNSGSSPSPSPSPAPASPAPAAPAPRSNSFGSAGSGSCTRELQMQAESTWRSVLMTSWTSISALRQSLAALAQVRGDKTVILISGGWPMDDREEMSTLNMVASEAAAARATIHTIYVPTATFSADRRMMTSTPLADSYLHSGPLETLAAMTGGGSFRAEVGADAAFERLGRELSGFYRIAIERDPSDADGKDRHMKVQVTKPGSGAATVRARAVFDVHTYEDRDWAARLGSAMEGPVTATEIALRVTNYVSPDFENPSKLKLLITGEASRLQAGDVTVRILISDLLGNRIAGGDVPLTHSNESTLPFSTNVSVAPGTYIARVAAIDSGGRVGSVDHRADAREVQLGPVSATGPVLVRVPRNDGTPYLALDSVRQDERLALELDLEGDATRLESMDVEFDIAATVDGPALLRPTAAISRTSRQGSALAQSVADMRVLPAGTYFVRAKVTSGTESLGELRRKITVIGAAGALTVAVAPKPTSAFGANSGKPNTAHPVARMPIAAAPGFTIEQVLAPQVLNTFLDRAAARPDASGTDLKSLLDQARTSGIKGLEVPDSMVKTAAVAGFLKGLTLLSESQSDQKKLDSAAIEFKSALNRAPDFFPSMIYLGASFAAGGKDKEAAAVWRTALIKEGNAAPLYIMLADAQLRQGRGDLAVEDLAKARDRWPDDDRLKRRFAVAALLAGQRDDGMKVLEELIASKADDETGVTVGLLVLYDAFESHQPIETAELDRARMLRLADTYRAHGYASQALVDTWVATATAGK